MFRTLVKSLLVASFIVMGMGSLSPAYSQFSRDADFEAEIEANTLVSARLLEERMTLMISRMSAIQ